MPADLEKAISEDDMADLLACLRAQPSPLDSLNPRETEEARQKVLKDGHDGLREIIRATEHAEQASFAGLVNMAFVRQLDGKHEVLWRTDPAPAVLAAGSQCSFHFPVAMGYKSQPGGSFTLYLEDRKLLDFDVSLESTAWRSEDGNVVLRYVARARNTEDSTGEMTLELPCQLVEPGKPVTLRVTGSASGSRRWFGLLPLR
jgi:hypothetical protein